MNINFTVDRQKLIRETIDVLVSNSQNYLNFNFKFSSEWNGLNKAVLFKCADIEKPVIVPIDDCACLVPSCVIKHGVTLMSVIGGNFAVVSEKPTSESIIITTNILRIDFEDTLSTDEIIPVFDTENALAEFIRSLSLNINVTFDDYPTENSNNAVKSKGIKAALDTKANKSDLENTANNLERGLSNKVDKVFGKDLSANDYTDEEVLKLSNLPTDEELEERFQNIEIDIIDTQRTLDEKQDILTFDSEPTYNSDNPVTSGGLYKQSEQLKQKSIPHADVTGYPITLSDHLSGEEFAKFNVYGSADGVGTLDSENGKYKIPIVQRGKNLFDISKVKSFVSTDYTTSRNTYSTISDGIVTSKIGVYANGAIWKDTKIKLPAGTYTLSADCMADKDTGNKTVVVYLYNFDLRKSQGKAHTLSSYRTWERLSSEIVLEEESEVAVLIQCTGVKADYTNLQIKIKNVQLEIGSSATEYEAYREKAVTAFFDSALGADEYIDLINEKLHSADAVTDITVTGDLTPLDGDSITFMCGGDVSPSKMEVTYYQDINKVIDELKNAILSQGGNV